MRDPNRIHDVMIAVEALWNKYPDWRFMQLMNNLQRAYGNDMFYVEDDKFKEFSEFFYNHYMEPNLLYFNEMVLEGKPIELLLKIFEDDFTNKDFKIWQEEGLIEKEDIVVNLDENKYDNDEEIFVSGSGLNPELYGFINNIEDSDDEALEQFFDFYNIKKPNSPSSILRNDFEER